MPLDSDFYKSSYERTFGDFLYDLRDEKKARQRSGGVEQDYQSPYDQVANERDMLFPEAEGLSEEEKGKLRKHQSRLRDLQPMENPNNVGSGRIAGNPYSIDTRSALKGVTDAATSVVNKERKDRIYGNEDKANRASRGAQAVGALGDLLGAEGLKKVREKSRDRREERYAGFADETQDLQEKEATAKERYQERQDYMKEQLPGRVEDQNDREHEESRDKTKAGYKEKLEGIKANNRKELAELNNAHDAEVAKLKSGGKDVRDQGQIYGRVYDMAENRIGINDKYIEKLNEERSFAEQGSEDYKKYTDRIEEAERKTRHLNNAMNYVRSLDPSETYNIDTLNEYEERVSMAGTDEYEEKYMNGGPENDSGENTGEVVDSDDGSGEEGYTVSDEDVAEYAELTGKSLEEARKELEEEAQGM